MLNLHVDSARCTNVARFVVIDVDPLDVVIVKSQRVVVVLRRRLECDRLSAALERLKTSTCCRRQSAHGPENKRKSKHESFERQTDISESIKRYAAKKEKKILEGILKALRLRRRSPGTGPGNPVPVFQFFDTRSSSGSASPSPGRKTQAEDV